MKSIILIKFAHEYVIGTLYCIVLYWSFSKAPLTVGLLASQRRSQRARPYGIEMALQFSSHVHTLSINISKEERTKHGYI